MILCALCAAASLAIEYILNAKFHNGVFRMINYDSPIVVIQSILFFVFCTRLSIKNKFSQKWLVKLSKVAFGAYLIDTSAFFKYVLKDMFRGWVTLPTIQLIIMIIGVSIIMFLGFLLLDYLRSVLFRVLKINLLIEKVSNCLISAMTKISI